MSDSHSGLFHPGEETPASLPGGEAAPALEDPRVVAALEKYLAAIEAGEKPNRQAFLARHADVAEALAECLDGLEALHVSASTPSHPPSSWEVPRDGEAGPADKTGDGPAGTPLGDFRLVREIGRGGMGVVYEAVQLSLDRRVALKVLPFAGALDAKQLQRFKNEARAAAHLHHTNIVPVYAVGAERGVHFYAMQLIEGQNLATVIADLRRSKEAAAPNGTPPRPSAAPTGPYLSAPPAATPPAADTRSVLGALSTQRTSRSAEYFRSVARLVAQAAEGLDYAHGVGVVHRDVKPANLLVDAAGNVWITDFGLAQFHADGGLTQTGDLLGTLRYMSPEQAGGQRVLIDHRTDLYSLGATLYELLTLRPIFDCPDRQTLLQQIMYDEPKPPRSVDRSIPAELETIVLKAIAKAPTERYATARDFAEDLHRFLRHEPILARRPTLVQRARKWLRRHPAVPAAAAGLLALLTAGSLIAAWLIQGEQEKTRLAYQQVWGEQERTRLAYQQEQARAREAEEQFRRARRAVDDMIQIAQEELTGKPHLEGPRKRLLDTALAYYEEFIEQRGDDPEAQAELKAAKANVKKILDDLVVLQGAGKVFLLAEPAVLKDLGPSGEQRQQIAELGRRLSRQRESTFKGFHKQTPEERARRFLELAHKNEAAVAAILTPAQRHRLDQINLQLQGAAAFRDTAMVSELKLTAEQKERLRAIEAEAFFLLFEPPGRGKGPSKPWKGSERARRFERDKILRVLTPAQQQRWQEMTGAPFEGDISFRPPPGSFRRHGEPPARGPDAPPDHHSPPGERRGVSSTCPEKSS
jgi:serine/threonine protein kinase